MTLIKEEAEFLGIQVDGRWGDARIQEEIDKFTGESEPVPRTNDARDTLALRIWEGQSISLPRNERVRRVEERLINKGYDLDGLELPE